MLRPELKQRTCKGQGWVCVLLELQRLLLELLQPLTIAAVVFGDTTVHQHCATMHNVGHRCVAKSWHPRLPASQRGINTADPPGGSGGRSP